MLALAKILPLFFVLLLGAARANSQDAEEIDSDVIPGIWFDGAEDVIADPDYLYIYLEGEPARLLYERMESSEVVDPCTGGPTKVSDEGEYQCSSAGGEEYQCMLAINYATGKLQNGLVDC